MTEYAGREQEIEAREKAAASGPWENVRPGGVPPGIICDIDGESRDITGEGDFIAHAREDIPYLLAQLGEARGKLAAAKEACKHRKFPIGSPPQAKWFVQEILDIVKGGD